MPNEPVQLLLNAGVLRAPREPSKPVNNGTDFFAGNDKGFAAHREELVIATRAIRRAIETSTDAGGLGYVKVVMKRRDREESSPAEGFVPQSMDSAGWYRWARRADLRSYAGMSR